MPVPLPGTSVAGGAGDQLAALLARLATTRTDISAGSDLLLLVEDDGAVTEVVLDPEENETHEEPWTPPDEDEAVG
ncbi:hypothetical protein [Streptomyces yaizuensis]|uniref:Uncharacterized protein n=1 Tax=Streptomyces yaizuensis TaxID=2989713 RepID=A0AA86MG60_9ACTN|nr:hypothetical protein [Streptomyces sp. YSPA8]BDT39534.1 hypothetical protein SYYSPA8_37080 [Streptomyces sp. YSPA8]